MKENCKCKPDDFRAYEMRFSMPPIAICVFVCGQKLKLAKIFLTIPCIHSPALYRIHRHCIIFTIVFSVCGRFPLGYFHFLCAHQPSREYASLFPFSFSSTSIISCMTCFFVEFFFFPLLFLSIFIVAFRLK